MSYGTRRVRPRPRADSFDDVEAAFFPHELSVEEYDLLRRGVAEALRVQDQSGVVGPSARAAVIAEYGR